MDIGHTGLGEFIGVSLSLRRSDPYLRCHATKKKMINADTNDSHHRKRGERCVSGRWKSVHRFIRNDLIYVSGHPSIHPFYPQMDNDQSKH